MIYKNMVSGLLSAVVKKDMGARGWLVRSSREEWPCSAWRRFGAPSSRAFFRLLRTILMRWRAQVVSLVCSGHRESLSPPTGEGECKKERNGKYQSTASFRIRLMAQEEVKLA
jgi:hypothetical protein